MESCEPCVGFGLSERPLSSVAQKILVAMRSGGLVDGDKGGDRTNTVEVNNQPGVECSGLRVGGKKEPPEQKNPCSLAGRTAGSPQELSAQSSSIWLTEQLSTDRPQKSGHSPALSRCLLRRWSPEASALQDTECTQRCFLTGNGSKENKETVALKRKHGACNNSSEGAQKQMVLDGGVDEFETQPDAGASGAHEGDLRDARYLDDWTRKQLLRKLRQAAALVATLLYKDGSTQLRADQAPLSSVKGIVLFLKGQERGSHSPGATTAPRGVPEDGWCVYLHTAPAPAGGREREAQLRFARHMLFQILRRKVPVICFNAKDFVKTALQVFGDGISWKHVADFVGLDPRIAAWLIDPRDATLAFEKLVTKYLEKSVTVHVGCTYGNSSRSMVNQNVCVNLRVLHRLTMQLCSQLKAYGLWQLFWTLELPLIPILAVMESHSIQVDRDEMERTSTLLGARLRELEQEAHFVAGERFLITSSSQLREILFGKLQLHLLSQRALPKTEPQKQPSTSEAVLNALRDVHPLPKIILDYRQVHKIKSTFVDGLLACMKQGSISCTWNQTGTVTGRLSAQHPVATQLELNQFEVGARSFPGHCRSLDGPVCSVRHFTAAASLNIQGISKHPIHITRPPNIKGAEDETPTISPRAMLVSSAGHSFLAADFSQIELRILAHLSGDEELLKLFQEPERDDVFSTLTAQWKDIPVEHVTHVDREQIKRVVYAVIYGAGKERLASCLGVPPQEAAQFLEMFLQKYKKIKDFAQATIAQCHRTGYVTSIMGRRRPLPRIHAQDQQLRAQAERQAVNFVVQGSAADLCKMAMIHTFTAVATSPSLTARLVAQIHDELLFEVQDAQVPEFAALVRASMESLPQAQALQLQLQVPLKVNLRVGRSWGHLAPLQEALDPRLSSSP